MRRGFAGVLAVAALVTLALPAHALADESLASTGSITYTWQGDPARGCAAAGLCAVHGELVVRLGEVSTVLSFGNGTTDVPLFGTSVTVRVMGPGGDCVDTAGGTFGGDLLLTRVHGRLLGEIEPALSSGHCAGPLQRDFARVRLPVARSGGKHPSFDLRTSRSFTAGPFSGRAVSTLRLHPAPSGGSFSTSSSGGSGQGVPTHNVLVEQVTLRYRVASLPGTLDAGFSGEADPFCAAFASCGASGSLALSVGTFQRGVVLTAERVVRKRVGARQALADLRHGRLSFGNGAFPLMPPLVLPTTASETFRAADGTQCQAESSSRQAELLIEAAPRGHSRSGLAVSLGESGDPGLLRTYCPGPNDTDVFGSGPALLSGSVAPTQLLRRHSVVSLSRSSSFTGLGYVGTRAGAVRFSLTLERVHAGTSESRGFGP